MLNAFVLYVTPNPPHVATPFIVRTLEDAIYYGSLSVRAMEADQGITGYHVELYAVTPDETYAWRGERGETILDLIYARMLAVNAAPSVIIQRAEGRAA